MSAHWKTEGVAVTASEQPETIHDFRGFPKELHEMTYPAKGSLALARKLLPLLYILPLRRDRERVAFFNEAVENAMAMTSVLVG